MAPPRYRHASAVLGISMFVMGGAGLVYEYVLSVLGNNLMGSSHEQIFVVIGIMLFAMGVAAAWQGRLETKLLDRFVLFQILLGTLGGLSVLATYAAFVHFASYRIVHYGFAFAVGFLVGLEIPLLLRINERYVPHLRRNLSQILTLDYVGALAGALLFAWVLLTRFDLERISLVLGLVNLLLGGIGLWYFRREVQHPRLLAVSLLAAALVLSVLVGTSPRVMADLEQRCYADPIVLAETTPYQRIVLTARGEVTNLYLNGHLQFSSADEAIYHELLVHPAMALSRSRRRVLVLGGGDGLAVREVLKWPDVREVVLVDIDPRMLELARTHERLVAINRGALSDARVRTRSAAGISPAESTDVELPSHLADDGLDDARYETAEVSVIAVDADLFVRDLGRDFDVAILDFPDPSTLEVAKLFSVEFYKSLLGRIGPETLVAVQSSSPFETRRAFLTVGASLEAAGYRRLPYRGHVPSFGEWGFWLAWHDGPAPEELRRRLEALPPLTIPTRYLDARGLAAAFAFPPAWLETKEPVRPNTKMSPVLVEEYTRARTRGS